MNDYRDEWDDDDDDDLDGIASVRKAHRASQKEVKQLRAELAAERKANRVRNLRDALQEKGINPKLAALYPSDQDTDPESVSKWIDEYADVLVPVAKQDSQSDSGRSDDPGVANAALSAEEVNAQEVLDRVSGERSLQAPGDASLAQRISAANDPDELLRIIQGGAG